MVFFLQQPECTKTVSFALHSTFIHLNTCPSQAEEGKMGTPTWEGGISPFLFLAGPLLNTYL